MQKKVEGEPDIRCETGWLALQPGERSVNYEVVSSEGVTLSAALVKADLTAAGAGQPACGDGPTLLAGQDMEAGYRQRFGEGLDNLAALMVLERVRSAEEMTIDLVRDQGSPSLASIEPGHGTC